MLCAVLTCDSVGGPERGRVANLWFCHPARNFHTSVDSGSRWSATGPTVAAVTDTEFSASEDMSVTVRLCTAEAQGLTGRDAGCVTSPTATGPRSRP